MRAPSFATALAIVLVGLTGARAETYPSHPITLIAPWPAGGAVDTLCRIFAAKLTDRLGKSVVVENRPGAGSVLGVAAIRIVSGDRREDPTTHRIQELIDEANSLLKALDEQRHSA